DRLCAARPDAGRYRGLHGRRRNDRVPAGQGHLSGVAFHLNPTAMRSIAGLAIVSTAISFMLFLRGLKALGPVRTAILSTIEPFCTALLGASVLGQPLTKDTLLGGAFIAGAVVLLQLKNENHAGRKT